MIDGEVYKTQSYEEGDVVIPEPSPTKDGYTFSGIDNLESVECKSTKVPDTHRTVFENSYVNYVSLYVPKESVEEYKSTAPWSEFKSITGI